MVDFLELNWDESCLAFYDNKRPVRTASVTQVRQPIYNRSVERWKKYARHIEPFRDEIE